ncbi:MAG: hypothetical protein GQ575_06555 [Deltaproteobacteria bacterium]|jgi:phosphate acetyltransferase|nr:hypothetical protein [Deltaproteobacteria bacterium]
MSNNLYVVATEARSGKSAIILGVMEMLLRKIDRVGRVHHDLSGQGRA